MQPPNFLQVTNGLRAALTIASGPSAGPMVGYRDRIADVSEAFARATEATDRSYTQWRRHVGEELRQLRRVRVELERTAELCLEHGLDDVPRHPIVYTERDHLLGLAAKVSAYLGAHASEWAWVSGTAERLGQLCAESTAATRTSAVSLANYQVAVQSRVAAYGAGVALLRELVRDAASVRHGAEFDAVRECAG